MIRFWLFVLPLTLILAACGGGGPAATVVVRGTATPTPTASPLPQVATALPAGFPDNPLRIMMIPRDRKRAEALRPQLENAILQTTSVTVEIVFAADRLELLDALCDTSSNSLTAIWADALTYSVASARRCGDATMWLTSDGITGETRQIVLSGTLQSRDLRSLQKKTFCRVSRDDFDTWLLPVLMLEGNNISVSSFEDVREYPDTTALLNAVALGECAGAGVATSTLVAWQATNPDVAENLVSVLESVSIPYGVLMYPFQIPLAARLSLTNQLSNMEAILLPTPTPTLTPEPSVTIEGGLAVTDVPATVATQEATAEATIAATQEATLEVTSEATAQAEATGEATQSATQEVGATAEATSEATAEIEAALTAEPTAEVTPEAPLDAAHDVETLLEPFIGRGKLAVLSVGDLQTLDDFLASSGLNFSQLGQ